MNKLREGTDKSRVRNALALIPDRTGTKRDVAQATGLSENAVASVFAADTAIRRNAPALDGSRPATWTLLPGVLDDVQAAATRLNGEASPHAPAPPCPIVPGVRVMSRKRLIDGNYTHFADCTTPEVAEYLRDALNFHAALAESKAFHEEHYPAALSRLQAAESALQAAQALATVLTAERDRLVQECIDAADARKVAEDAKDAEIARLREALECIADWEPTAHPSEPKGMSIIDAIAAADHRDREVVRHIAERLMGLPARAYEDAMTCLRADFPTAFKEPPMPEQTKPETVTVPCTTAAIEALENVRAKTLADGYYAESDAIRHIDDELAALRPKAEDERRYVLATEHFDAMTDKITGVNILTVADLAKRHGLFTEQQVRAACCSYGVGSPIVQPGTTERIITALRAAAGGGA